LPHIVIEGHAELFHHCPVAHQSVLYARPHLCDYLTRKKNISDSFK